MKKLLVGIATVTTTLSLLFYSQIAVVILIIGYVLAGVLGLVIMVGGFFGAWFLAERLRLIRAARIEAEKQAHVLTITDNGETWMRDTDSRATWRNLTGTPALYINDQYHEPSNLEIELFRYRLAMMQKAPKIINSTAEPLPLPIQPVDLLTAFDSVQRCLIVGASDSGKTTLLQWLVFRRRHISKVVVLDPHAWPGKWAGCYVIGTGRNYDEINRALAGLVQIMTKRYDEIGRGLIREGYHPRITILIDEWRAIVQQLGKPASEAIKSLLTESRKAAFSVFVASHSDRAKPLGLEGEYDLKDGFAIVRLSIENGQRIATLDTGNGEVPVRLPGEFTASVSNPQSQSAIIPASNSPKEKKIMSMFEAGASYNQIAREVYGSVGGKQTELIKRIITQNS